MRLGEKKIICIRKSRESWRGFCAFFILFLVLLLISVSIIYFVEKVQPTMIELAKTKGNQMALQAINDAVTDVFSGTTVKYDDIVLLEKKDDGSVSAVQSNLEGINRLKSVITKKIQENIDKNDTATISIPLGTLLGNDFLAGVGPRLKVTYVPYGISKVEFFSDFEDSGINQTRLVINLDVETTVGLLMPTINTSTKVKTTLPVLQTIIVGDVPDSYTNVEREGYDYEDDVLELKD